MERHQRVDLHPGIVERLRAEALGETWQTQLLEAGLLTTVARPQGDGWSPTGALREIAEELAGLLACEGRITATEVHKPFRTGAVHPGVPITIFVSVWVLINFIGSVFWGLGIAAIGWGALALAGLGYVLWFDQRKRALLAELDREKQARRAALVEGVRAIFSRSFVAWTGRRLVVCEPHRIWAAARLLALPRPASGDRELAGLRDDLAAVEAGREAALEAALADAPDDWTDLSVDMRDLLGRLREAGHPPFVPRQRLEALLAGDR